MRRWRRVWDQRCTAVEEDLRLRKHFHGDIIEAMLVCALRFDGYRYLEVVHPKLSKESRFSPLVERSWTLCRFTPILTVILPSSSPYKRSLHKWGGEHLTKYSREHVAYDHPFLMLYRQPVPKDFVDRGYDLRWEREIRKQSRKDSGIRPE